MIWTISLCLAVVLCIVIVVYWIVKSSFQSKYERRRELQSQFAAFAASNRVMDMDQARIDDFWNLTSDTWHYFTSSDVHHLRQTLYDNAQSLVTINEELATCRPDSQLYHELKSSKSNALIWFADTLEHMEHIFAPETKKNPDFKDVGKECLRRLARILRA